MPCPRLNLPQRPVQPQLRGHNPLLQRWIRPMNAVRTRTWKLGTWIMFLELFVIKFDYALKKLDGMGIQERLTHFRNLSILLPILSILVYA